jgi:hypothetical protein
MKDRAHVLVIFEQPCGAVSSAFGEFLTANAKNRQQTQASNPAMAFLFMVPDLDAG